MADLHGTIETLLSARGITGYKMSADLGMSRSFMTNLKMGRSKSITADTAQKIADYFEVTVGQLLGSEDTKKEPTPNGKVNDEDIKFALWGDTDDISDADLDDVRRYAAFVRERKKGGK